MKTAIIYLTCSAADIIVFAVSALVFAMFGDWRSSFWHQAWWFRWRWNSWATRLIRGGRKSWAASCLGHVVWAYAVVTARLVKHESGHTEQFEGDMMKGFIYGAAIFAVTGNWILGLVLWAISSPVAVLSRSFVAYLRGENFYKGASHEEGAASSGTLPAWL